MLFFMSTLFYWIGMFIARQGQTTQGNALELLGSRMAWVAVAMALIGTMVRWYESYLHWPGHGPHPGQQPVRSVRACSAG